MPTIAGETNMENLIDNLPKAVGATVRHFRAQRNWRQSDLAEATNLSQSTISSIENGASQNTENLLMVARSLGMKVSELYAAAENLEARSPALRALASHLTQAATALEPAEIEALFRQVIESE